MLDLLGRSRVWLLLVTTLGACAPAVTDTEADEEAPPVDELTSAQEIYGGDLEPSSRYRYEEVEGGGELYVTGSRDRLAIDPSDVSQGGITDCWLMASFASIARVKPAAIERLIRRRTDGRYDVTLYVGPEHRDNHGTLYRDPVVFNVSATFPTKPDGALAYARWQDVAADYKKEIWPLLLEKAYAQYLGAYSGVVPLFGRNLQYDVTPAFNQLLPRGEQLTFDLNSLEQQPDVILSILGDAFDHHRPTTALVTSPAQIANVILRTQWGIDTWHHYSIARVDRVARTIDLQDPRVNANHPKNVPIDVFRAVFRLYTVGPSAD